VAASAPFAGGDVAEEVGHRRCRAVDHGGVDDLPLARAGGLDQATFDNRNSAQEALIQLKAAIDQGYRYVLQGLSSNVTAALIDAISKHNERNPGKEVLLLNYISSDPELTNAKCSFWHFRFEANVDMKTEAVTTLLAEDPKIGRVYIIGPNFAMGQQTSRSVKDLFKRKKPGIEIVGDDLLPVSQVKDFSPYVAKIKAAEADIVITSNFAGDLIGLIKAAKDADLKASFFAFYGGNPGVAAALGAAGVDRVRTTMLWNPNNPAGAGRELVESFKKKFPDDDVYLPNLFNLFAMLGTAIKQARSTDPVKVAYTMEGLKIRGLADEIEMRKSDHQLQQPQYATSFVKTNGKDIKYDMDKSGFGWKTVRRFDSYVSAQPTSCQMKRPAL